MSYIRAISLLGSLLILLMVGCVPHKIVWTADSSGFFYSVPQGKNGTSTIVQYRIDKKAKRVVVADVDAEVGFPAVSPDGQQVAIIRAARTKEQCSVRVLVYDLTGQLVDSSKDFVWGPGDASLESPHFLETCVEWSPKGDKLLFSVDLFVDHTLGHYDLKTKKLIQVKKDLMPFSFGAYTSMSCIDPDGSGFLTILRTAEAESQGPHFVFVDWDGWEYDLKENGDWKDSKAIFEGSGDQLRVSSLSDGQWENGVAKLTGEGGFILLDTKMRIATCHVNKEAGHQKKADGEQVTVVARLQDGQTLVQVRLMTTPNIVAGETKATKPSMQRIEVRKPKEGKTRSLVDNVEGEILAYPSPDRKYVAVVYEKVDRTGLQPPAPPTSPLEDPNATTHKIERFHNHNLILIDASGSTVDHYELFRDIQEEVVQPEPEVAPASAAESPTVGNGPTQPAQATPPVQPLDADALLDITPMAGIDERLFLLRALERMYEQLPPADTNSKQLQEALGSLRHDANRHYQYIKDRNLDEKIASLYLDYVKMIDGYADFLADIGRIERGGVARAEKETTETAFQSGYLGGATIAATGLTGGTALLAVAGVAMFDFMLEDYAKGQARDEAKRQAVATATRKLQAISSDSIARAQSVAVALNEKYGWNRGEAGFDLPQEQARLAHDLALKGDLRELLRFASLARQRRPRDPFALASHSYIELVSLGKDAPTEALKAGMKDCLAAARLVPKEAFFDSYRATFIALAGYLANGAAGAERVGKGWSADPTPMGGEAVRVWKTYFVYDAHDSSGEAREQLTWALAFAGRYPEAVASASAIAPLRSKNQSFAYNFACLLSVTGATQDSFRWLEYAIKNCHYVDVIHARSDPDLAKMRAEQAKSFSDLCAVKWKWYMDWGAFSHDDVCLTNNSAFPISNVTLTVTVTSSSSRASWTKQFAIARIEPATTYKWSTWVSSRASDNSCTATLNCDQSRSEGGKKTITNTIGMTLALIPAGEFDMGSPATDTDAYDDEKPLHRVRITKPYYLGTTEVTQGQYRAVTGENPSIFKGSDDLPVEGVSWNDAIAFCNKLCEKEGLKPYYQFGAGASSGGDGYRLPTEAEWEYACRAGSQARYSFGDDNAQLDLYAWYDKNSDKKTHPVGQKRPNAFGLYDMHGNVWEWCWDGDENKYYASLPSPVDDPSGPATASIRVNRGGGWFNVPRGARAAYRDGAAPGGRSSVLGFRVARVQSGQ